MGSDSMEPQLQRAVGEPLESRQMEQWNSAELHGAAAAAAETGR